VNVDGETGLVVRVSDPGALREAMGRLWNDDILARRLGEAAALRFRSLFTADLMVDKYVDLYRRLTSKV
jgi:rhamnosyl/mannosyltransferase